MNSQTVLNYLQDLQNRIVEALELVDGKRFLHDSWQRSEGGGGTSCLLEDGNVFERAGVGFSHVMGNKLPPSATAAHPEAAGRSWEAMGVSLVLHPRNPFVPTVHMNVRFFVAKAPMPEMQSAKYQGASQGAESNAGAALETQPISWFGGGMDLTPYYGFEDDAIHFHRTCRDALAPFGAGYYPRFKQACDQ